MSRRVVLNADDFGYDPAVSRGIARAMRDGIVSSTTMMVNTPHSEHAASLADGLAIGLHVNLARWSAVSDSRLFVEADAATLAPSFVEDETAAQLDRLIALIGRPATHVDVHKHLHRHQNVLEGLCRTAKARSLKVRSIDPALRAKVRALGVETNDAFFGDAGVEAYWTLERLRAVVDGLPSDGLLELMCHPGEAPSHVTSGYSSQREVELATFVSADARALLEARGLRFERWS